MHFTFYDDTYRNEDCEKETTKYSSGDHDLQLLQMI